MPPPHSPWCSSDKALLTAWLLLLLDRESYGWALIGALRERGIRVDPGRAYRKLHELELDGAVTSRWTDSDAGPKRRSYRRTAKGRRMLAQLTAAAAARRDQHDSFIRAHRRDKGPDDVGARKAPPNAPAGDMPAPGPTSELTEAWLLLLLENGATHGYGLRQTLSEHGLDPDPATLYRTLRKLDREHRVQSRWTPSLAGPRRRVYRITPAGRLHRDELAAAIAEVRDYHTALLSAYEHLVDAHHRTPFYTTSRSRAKRP